MGTAENKAVLRRIVDEVISRKTSIWPTTCTPKSTSFTLKRPASVAVPRG